MQHFRCPCSLAHYPEPEGLRKAKRRWAELLRRILEVDPLACPRCGEEMRIVSFIATGVLGCAAESIQPESQPDRVIERRLSPPPRHQEPYVTAWTDQIPPCILTRSGLKFLSRYRDAEALYRRAIAVRETGSGRALAETLREYANLLRSMDRTSEAEDLEARAASVASEGSN